MLKRTQPLHQSPTPTSNGALLTPPSQPDHQPRAPLAVRGAQEAQGLDPPLVSLITGSAEELDTLARPLVSPAQLAPL